MLTIADRISGGLIGLLIGDALGVPFEFNPPSSLPDLSNLDFHPPPRFRRSHFSVPPGTWSDDGAQALCLLASLLECECLDLLDLSRKLLSWYHEKAFTPDRVVFDCGIQTRAAIRALDKGVAPELAGPRDEQNNGNGSLMRVLPIAMWHLGSDAELFADACRQSLVTHGHLRSQLCCGFYVLWARELLQGARDGWDAVAAKFMQLTPDEHDAKKEAAFILSPSHRASACGSGYVLNTLWSARLAMEQEDYFSVVRAAIAFGNDTDTTACIAGGLAGIRDGLASVPLHWRSNLRGREVFEPLLQTLLQRTCGHTSDTAPPG
jgi:ADP-ribosylglycohydrolase